MDDDFRSAILPQLFDIPDVDIDRLLSDELTVVTAFFDIGPFQKGPGGPTLSSAAYRRWMSVFARLDNPLVAYFDQPSDVELMRIYRQRHPVNRTRIVLVDRQKTVSFGRYQPRIDAVFQQPGYPRRQPNTANADYSAAMHAKYELMGRTITDNPFATRFYCWLDLGLFRRLLPPNAEGDNLISQLLTNDGEETSIRLRLPVGFQDNRIAYSEVAVPRSDPKAPSIEDIVRHDYVWVCGCFFVGRADKMATWAVEYMRAVDRMLNLGWISTDQQVLYWLFHGGGRRHTRLSTKIQTYSDPRGESSRYNKWFYLAYLAKEAGDEASSVDIGDATDFQLSDRRKNKSKPRRTIAK